jgi:hypothetical protein
MSIGDVRFTVLQTVNEVQRKLGLSSTSLSSNKVSLELIDHINDVVDDLSDFGNWMETLATAKVTAHTSVRDYSIPVSAVVKNIGDIYISTRRGPLRSVDIDTMRIMTRVTALGQPSQFCIFGTDSNGNPNIRVRPTPDTAQDGAMFSILYYTKPPHYTVSDSSTIIPFPSRVVVLGTLAKYTLRESGGAPTQQYASYFQEYATARKEAFNRFRGDTGWDVSFKPSRGRWRR